MFLKTVCHHKHNYYFRNVQNIIIMFTIPAYVQSNIEKSEQQWDHETRNSLWLLVLFNGIPYAHFAKKKKRILHVTRVWRPYAWHHSNKPPPLVRLYRVLIELLTAEREEVWKIHKTSFRHLGILLLQKKLIFWIFRTCSLSAVSDSFILWQEWPH
jgi:hypothetical protein